MRVGAIVAVLVLGCSGTAARLSTPNPPVAARSARAEQLFARSQSGTANEGLETEDVGQAFMMAMLSHEFTNAAHRFDDGMAKSLPGSKLESAWLEIETSAGKATSCSALEEVVRPSRTHTWFACEFESGTWLAEVVVNPSKHISGLRLMPAPPAWRPPSYVALSSFTERTMNLGQPPLPAIVTIPKAPTGAIVVLVHGSGPQDEDASSGPGRMGSKIFKDLAWGLASRGIAVVRYPKRSWTYPEQFERVAFTLDDEVTRDACAAVSQARRVLPAPSTRVFVIGHSLGAALAPRIARICQNVSGLVLMAGPSRNLTDVLFDQFNYLLPMAGKNQADIALGLGELMAGFAIATIPTNTKNDEMEFSGMRGPRSYWADVDAYDPIAEATVGPRVPMLVLQGARDYQVTIKDFAGWEKSLRGQSRATFRLYPALNHRFILGHGRPSPADNQRGGNVSAQVIGDIAAWIDSQQRR